MFNIFNKNKNTINAESLMVKQDTQKYNLRVGQADKKNNEFEKLKKCYL